MPYRECAVPIETTVFEEVLKANTEEELEKVLENHQDTSLHPNHWLMMDCRQEVVKRMFNSIATTKPVDKLIERAHVMLGYCKALKQVTDAFYPGHNRIKGTFNMQTAQTDTCTRLMC